MNRSAALALAAVLPLSACAAEIGDSEDPELEEIEKLTYNKLTYNALTYNALSANFHANKEMTQYPLETRYYADDSGTAMAYQLHDALTREFFSYVASCALDSKQVVYYEDTLTTNADGTHPWYKFPGSLGLCPDWHTGPASAACQEVVSSCLLARNNAYGVSVALSMRGHDEHGNRLLLGATEATDFPWREGAFYGNIFDTSALNSAVDVYVDPTYVSPTGSNEKVVGRNFSVDVVYQNMWACWSSIWNWPDAYAQERVCAGGSSNCAAQAVGACRYHPYTGPLYQCDINDLDKNGDEDYQKCRDKSGTVLFKNAITVFLQKPCAILGDSQDCTLNRWSAYYGPNFWDPYDASKE